MEDQVCISLVHVLSTRSEKYNSRVLSSCTSTLSRVNSSAASAVVTKLMPSNTFGRAGSPSIIQKQSARARKLFVFFINFSLHYKKHTPKALTGSAIGLIIKYFSHQLNYTKAIIN